MILNEIVIELRNQFPDLIEAVRNDLYGGKRNIYEKLSSHDGISWISLFRMIYMNTLAKREEFSQDFTPDCLAKMTAGVSVTGKEKWIMDLCSGCGCLTIECFRKNPGAHFIAVEYDEDMIVFLQYVFVCEGINGIIIHRDVLSGETFATYSIENGKISGIIEFDPASAEIDLCVSNPPFNINNDKFIRETFIAKNSTLILPGGIVNHLSGYSSKIRSVIYCGGNLFDKTTTNIIVVQFCEHSDTVTFFDLSQYYISKTVIERRGGFDESDKSHYNRIYRKELNEIIPGTGEAILQLTGKDFPCLCATKLHSEIGGDYNHRKYINYEENTIPGIDRLNSLINNYNSSIEASNAFTATVNETWLKDRPDFQAIDLNDENEKLTDRINDTFDGITKNNDLIKVERMKKNKYLTRTKCNDIQFVFHKLNHNSLFADVSAINIVWNMFVQHQMTMNYMKNKFLGDIRDELTELLMSNKLKIGE
jgi:hypothetical protein